MAAKKKATTPSQGKSAKVGQRETAYSDILGSMHAAILKRLR